MEDVLLVTAGIGGMLIALAHGFIGHHKILKYVAGLSDSQRRLNYAVFQMSTIYWFVGGLSLLLTPIFFAPSQRMIIATAVAFLYLVGAVGNGWITRGRHFGAYVLFAVALLAILGI